jgi:DNA-binding CsgD family transcriptional regulator
MPDLDRLIHRLYRVVALEPDWERARTSALNELVTWGNAHSAFWLTGALHHDKPLQTATSAADDTLAQALIDLEVTSPARGIWLDPLPKALTDSNGVATRGYLIDLHHRDTQLTSRVLIRYTGSTPFTSDVLCHATGHLIEAGTLALDLLLARDSWLGAMGRTARGAGALIDAAGVYYAASAAFCQLMAGSFGNGVATGQLPVSIRHDTLQSNKTFALGKLQARASPQGPLWLMHVRAALPIDKLSPREQEVARHLSEGKTFKRIAQQLGLSPSTVANHSASIYRKLGVYRREELISQVRTDATRKSS